MKTREIIKRVRKTKQWYPKRVLLSDPPGTEFDWQISDVLGAIRIRDLPGMKELCDGMLLAFGSDLAKKVESGDSDFFRRFADALDGCVNHRPVPDTLRRDILDYCLPPTRAFAMKDILRHLKDKGHRIDESTARKVYRIAPELGVKIEGQRGAPKKYDTKDRKPRR